MFGAQMIPGAERKGGLDTTMLHLGDEQGRSGVTYFYLIFPSFNSKYIENSEYKLWVGNKFYLH